MRHAVSAERRGSGSGASCVGTRLPPRRALTLHCCTAAPLHGCTALPKIAPRLLGPLAARPCLLPPRPEHRQRRRQSIFVHAGCAARRPSPGRSCLPACQPASLPAWAARLSLIRCVPTPRCSRPRAHSHRDRGERFLARLLRPPCVRHVRLAGLCIVLAAARSLVPAAGVETTAHGP
jgi:hypothetical protein